MDLRSEAEISQAVAGVHETLVMRGGEERDWGCESQGAAQGGERPCGRGF